MKYKISTPHPVNHLIEIEMIADEISSGEIMFQLPSWRPGRYELQNFAKNVQRWNAFDEEGNALAFKKVSKDSWSVKAENAKAIHIRYNYYAAQLDAGACWCDEEQVYINPIHCCLYIAERMHEKCFVEIDLPKAYQIATSLNKISDQLLSANDYHELVDSPIIASPLLQHNSYDVNETKFHIWFQGDCKPDWVRIINDFRKFTKEQLSMMEDIQVKEYHFLVQVLPYKFYHGVEHIGSTVLAIGPGAELMNENLYTDFIGVASHELFHVWNVKTIRPHEMMPYDYTKENYSRLGFVYEGVTTYYGDLFLVRSGVYSLEQFFSEINVRLQKHFDNYGRFNLSVADSSFDTWLDGYVPGIPNRKTSIYDEGCLIALMTDLLIRKKTDNEKSIDDVMRILYNDFGKKKIGYTENDYISIIENLTGEDVSDFFIDFVYGTENYKPLLELLLQDAGCMLERLPAKNYFEQYFGFKTSSDNSRVTSIVPNSEADKSGLGKEDEIISVNDIKVENNLNDLCKLFEGREIMLTVSTPMKKLKSILLEPSTENYFPQYKLRKKPQATTYQQRFFNNWLKALW